MQRKTTTRPRCFIRTESSVTWQMSSTPIASCFDPGAHTNKCRWLNVERLGTAVAATISNFQINAARNVCIEGNTAFYIQIGRQSNSASHHLPSQHNPFKWNHFYHRSMRGLYAAVKSIHFATQIDPKSL